MVKSSVASKMRDTSGASIVIALVFFLICAIIGSVVLTAASVSAKAAQTHQELQQAEFVVGSAAQTIGYDLDMAQCQVVVDPTDGLQSVEESASFSQFSPSFWKTYGKEILESRAQGKAFEVPDALTISQDKAGTVVGKVTVDANLNIAIRLSMKDAAPDVQPYDMTVDIQCVPTFDVAGNLKSFEYERAVIRKTGEVR